MIKDFSLWEIYRLLIVFMALIVYRVINYSLIAWLGYESLKLVRKAISFRLIYLKENFNCFFNNFPIILELDIKRMKILYF